jgi:hypothetical protein
MKHILSSRAGRFKATGFVTGTHEFLPVWHIHTLYSLTRWRVEEPKHHLGYRNT